MKMCNDCKKRETCVRLCAEAEKYVSQDSSNTSAEFIQYWDPQILDQKKVTSDYKEWFGVTTDPVVLVYQLYFIDKMPVPEIQYHISFSQQYISKIIRFFKDSVPNDGTRKATILKLYYIENKSVKEICSILDRKRQTVETVIRRHLDKLGKIKRK